MAFYRNTDSTINQQHQWKPFPLLFRHYNRNSIKFWLVCSVTVWLLRYNCVCCTLYDTVIIYSIFNCKPYFVFVSRRVTINKISTIASIDENIPSTSTSHVRCTFISKKANNVFCLCCWYVYILCMILYCTDTWHLYLEIIKKHFKHNKYVFKLNVLTANQSYYLITLVTMRFDQLYWHL